MERQYSAGGNKSFGFCASYSGSITAPTNETFNGDAIDFSYINNTGNIALPIQTDVSGIIQTQIQNDMLIFPNMTSGSSMLKYHLLDASPVRILLYDQTRKEVQILVNEQTYKGGGFLGVGGNGFGCWSVFGKDGF